MIRVRRRDDRGHFDHGWLETYHSFSFSEYHDPQQMGFRALRVINEDVIAGGRGFGLHPHKDMEIITYVLEGGLSHRDSLGSVGTIRPGELQRMTAGTGIRHSEFNASETSPVHLYQIWLLPERTGLKPTYEQKAFPEEGRKNRLQLVAAPPRSSVDDGAGALTIRQDAFLYLGALDPGQTVGHRLAEGRHGWLQVLRGAVKLNGQTLIAGDGAAISNEPSLSIEGTSTDSNRAAGPATAEVLLFDLA